MLTASVVLSGRRFLTLSSRPSERGAGIQSVTLMMFRNGSRITERRYALFGFRDDAFRVLRRRLADSVARPSLLPLWEKVDRRTAPRRMRGAARTSKVTLKEKSTPA
jgi:hypothetical protein